MNPDEIELSSIDKMFEYEKHSRFIDEMSFSELKNFSKVYCKLYLKQQEVLSLFSDDDI
jgi:hypothetical protein